jgi:hypothetical protein
VDLDFAMVFAAQRKNNFSDRNRFGSFPQQIRLVNRGSPGKANCSRPFWLSKEKAALLEQGGLFNWRKEVISLCQSCFGSSSKCSSD